MLSSLSSVVKMVGPVGAAAGATVALPLGLVCWVKQGRMQQLQADKDRLECRLQQAVDDTAAAKAQLQQQKRFAAQLRRVTNRTLRSAHADKVQVQELQRHLAAAELALEQQRAQVSGLQGLVDALLADVAAVQQQLQDTQQELQQMQAQNKELKATQASTLAHLRLQLQRSEGQIHEARQMLTDKAAAYTLLMQEKADLAVQSMQLQEAVDAKDTLLQQQRCALQAAAQAAAAQQAQRQALTQQLQAQMAAADASNMQLQQVAKAKDSMINQLMTKLATQAAAAQAAEEAAAQRAADHQIQLQACATAYHVDRADLTAAHQQAVAALVAAHTAELAANRRQHSEELTQLTAHLTAQHKVEVTGLTSQLRQQQKELQQLKAALAASEAHQHTRRSSSSSCSTESLLEPLAPVTSCSSSSLYAALEAPSEEPSSSCCVEEGQLDLPVPAAASGYPTSWEDVMGPSAEQEQQQDKANVTSKETHLPHKAGLANPTGSNFCCSNALSQALRAHEGVVQGPAQLPEHSVDYVVEQQRGLLRRMSAAEAAYTPGDGRVVVDPSQLCDVLAIASGCEANQMQDVGDVDTTLLNSCGASQAPGPFLNSRGAVADTTFGFLVAQAVPCKPCGKVTHSMAPTWQHQVAFSSSELCQLGQACPGAPQQQLLAQVLQETKSCDRDQGGCGQQMAVSKALLSAPQVAVLAPTWPLQVTGQDIRATLGHLPQHLDLAQLFDASQVPASQTLYWLTTMVVYYGQHYLAFMFCGELGQWLQADDACVKLVGQQGTWQEVVQKCTDGRLQPGLVTYQQVEQQELARLQALQQQQEQLLLQQQQQQQQEVCRAAGEGAVVGCQAAGGASGADGQSVLSKRQKARLREKAAKAAKQAGKQAGRR